MLVQLLVAFFLALTLLRSHVCLCFSFFQLLGRKCKHILASAQQRQNASLISQNRFFCSFDMLVQLLVAFFLALTLLRSHVCLCFSFFQLLGRKCKRILASAQQRQNASLISQNRFFCSFDMLVQLL